MMIESQRDSLVLRIDRLERNNRYLSGFTESQAYPISSEEEEEEEEEVPL